MARAWGFPVAHARTGGATRPKCVDTGVRPYAVTSLACSSIPGFASNLNKKNAFLFDTTPFIQSYTQ